MKQRHLTAVITLLCLGLATLAGAEEATIWNKMKNRLETLSPQKKLTTTTAVGGVRGAKDQPADTLYWKSEEKMQEIDATEYARFNEAYEAATGGRKEEATAKFAAFVQEFPASPLKGDAEEALAALKAE